MIRTLLFLFLHLSVPAALLAQETPFEQQLVQLADGSESQLWISLDEQSDLLHYKTNPKATASIYSAEEVVSFTYVNQQYYSLPQQDGYFTFFKVLHEGNEFALLEKNPSFKALRIIADESNGTLSTCQNSKSKKFYLCSNHNSSGTNFNGQPYAINHVIEFEVHKLVYLAIEDKLKLFYMETDERFNFWDNWMGPRPGKRRTDKMLEEFIEDPEKRSLIKKKVKQEKLDIRIPEQLILALEAVYQ